MTHQGSLTEHITRSLAFMLRHQPEDFDLELDAQGFADLGDVVQALNERLGEPIDEGDLLQAIESGDRPRYQVQDDRIRALYGHSFPIDPGDPSEPPELLYVGVGSRDAERANERELRGGRRAFLHLALTSDDAVETGRRIAPKYAVITVRAREAFEDGVQFYDRQSLFLAESIPTPYIEVGSVRSMAPWTSPAANCGSHSCFSSSDAKVWMSSATPACRPSTVIRPASARATICSTTFMTNEGRSKPP